MGTKKVSVIIYLHNEESSIEKCLRSVLDNSLKEIEIICIGSHSVDMSISVLETYKKKYSDIIQIIKDSKKLSILEAFTQGALSASGEYVLLLSGDDYVTEKLSDCYTAITSSTIPLVGPVVSNDASFLEGRLLQRDTCIQSLKKINSIKQGQPLSREEFNQTVQRAILEEMCHFWFYNLSGEEKQEGFEFLCTLWDFDPAYVLSTLANKFYYSRKEIAQGVVLSPHFQYKPRKNCTLALHYAKIVNGGAERVVAMLCNLFVESGYKVILVTDEPPDPADYPLSSDVIREELPHFSLFPQKDYYERAKAWNAIIDKHSIDVVFNSSWLCPTASWDMYIIKSHPSHPAYVLHTHGSCGCLFLYGDIISGMWAWPPIADAVVGLSRYDKQFWGYINPRSYCILNPCFIDTTEIVQTLPMVRKSNKILWVGRLSDQKQPFEIIKVMKYLVRVTPEVVCSVVGEGESAIKNKLIDLIHSEGLENNIVLEGYKEDLSKFYQESAVLFTTAKFEGFSLVLFEGAAYGLPTVSYDLPWLEYYHILDGWDRVEQNNAAGLAKKITRLLRDEVYWTEQSNKLFHSFQKFNQQDILADWKRLLSDIETQTEPLLQNHRQEGILLKEFSVHHSLSVHRCESLLQEEKAKIESIEAECMSLADQLAMGKKELESSHNKLESSHNKNKELQREFANLSNSRRALLGRLFKIQKEKVWTRVKQVVK